MDFMRVLGIDPGIGRCGWGVIEQNGMKVKAIAFDCLETEAKKEVPVRLAQIHKEVTGIIKKYSPDALSIEDLFFSSNSKTAFVVGQARGVILLAAAQANLPVFIYTPLQVKIAVTGYGRAEKPQIGKMIKTLLLLPEVPKPDDTADALAIALTHAFSAKTLKYGK
jgi:crossover junction endodeoxyribonuclease RuvC